MRLHTTWVTLCGLLISCGSDGHIVPERVSCARCEIQATVELDIGSEDGPGSLLGRPTRLIMDGAGRYWVTMLDYGFPYVFDKEGRFLQQFGQPGGGPGEFRAAYVTIGLPGDSVLLDATPFYVVVGPDLTIVRMIRKPRGYYTDQKVSSWPDDVLAVKIDYAQGVESAEVLSLDMSGEGVVEGDTLLYISGDAPYRRIAPPTSDGIWVADVTRYMLRHYTHSGIALDSLERQPDWFPVGDRQNEGSPTQAPTPGVVGLRPDTLGRLWVFLEQPRSDWHDAWRGISFPEGVGEVRVSSLPPGYQLWRTVVEVIDIELSRVVARTTLDGHVFAVLGSDRVATYIETESGIPIVKIHKLTLVER